MSKYTVTADQVTRFYPTLDIYHSPAGADNWWVADYAQMRGSGPTLYDGPFASEQKARARLREIRKAAAKVAGHAPQ